MYIYFRKYRLVSVFNIETCVLVNPYPLIVMEEHHRRVLSFKMFFKLRNEEFLVINIYQTKILVQESRTGKTVATNNLKGLSYLITMLPYTNNTHKQTLLEMCHVSLLCINLSVCVSSTLLR